MTVLPLGDTAVLLEWGGAVSAESAHRAQRVARALAGADLAGMLDVVPAHGGVAVFYEPGRIGDYDGWCAHLASRARAAAEAPADENRGREREIPVCYGGEFGPDLAEVAARAGRSEAEAIALHTGAEYEVYAVGFMPGFAYLGGLPEPLHCARRDTPRAQVAAGSVGIGGAQTGVYPLATPGGWNLIGRTPLRLFDPEREQPAWLQPGDRVRFRAIGREEFDAWR